MKKRKVLTIILVFIMLISCIPINTLADATSSFKDMPKEGFWSTGALKAAVENGLINGFKEKDGIYIKPNAPITRAQIATIVNRSFGAEESSLLTGNNDVVLGEWYYKEMQKAVKMGTMKLDTRMRPNDNITRQEAFTILGRALKMEGGSKKDFASFSDSSQVADWATSTMGDMVKSGYIKGSNNKLDPKANMTRAQFAQIMDNVIKEYGAKEGTITKVRSGNIMVNIAGVTLKNLTIEGDLIIGDGVGKGPVTLDNVTVKGRLIDRSKKGSLIIKNNTEIEGEKIVEKIDPIIDEKIQATAINSKATLKESALSGTFKNKSGEKVHGTLKWTDSKTVVIETGEYSWIFTPEDIEIYNTITGKVTVKVEMQVSDFSGGTGTESDPYQVSTAKELNNIRNHLGKHFIQTADINLGLAPWNTGQGWDPVGNSSGEFGGTYNGQGYKITGLTIKRDKDTNFMCGLFGRNGYSSELKNIALVNVDISGKDNIGSLLGYSRGNVYNCYATGSVTGNKMVGGLIGFTEKGNVRDSYSTCSVTGNENVGGLTGYISNGGAIYNCYAVGLVTGNNSVGGLVGIKFWPSIIVSQSYYDKDTTGQNDTGKGEGKTTSQMTKKSTFDGWDFDSTWGLINYPASYPYLKWQEDNIPYGFARGTGTESDPYQVSTAKELNNIRNHLGKHFIQTADINLGLAPWNTGQGWDPLGNSSGEFGGTYNGQGYKITGLTIKRDKDTDPMCGLFGRNGKSSELKNIALVDVNISGKDNIGSLLGYSRGNVYNCYATGSVAGNEKVGGLIGFVEKGNVRDSYSTCSVKGNEKVGGLTGYISDGGAIYNCYAMGLVTGNSNVGGLVGTKFWSSIIVSQSYYDKDTTGQNDTGKGEGKTTSQMTKKSTFDGWDFDSTWGLINYPASYPYLKWQEDNIPYGFTQGNGTESDPYQVSTAKELNNVRNHLGKHFIQTADINLGLAPWNTGQGWDPLGNSSGEFGGTYNGQGYKITGLTIKRDKDTDSMCGLFGRNSYSSELKNIALVNVDISGKDNIGSLLGYSRGNVDNCYATGSVAGNEKVGGLIGFVEKGNVRDSYSTCSVKANDRVGGLTGYISDGGAIYNCYAVGLVTGNNSVGGLVGIKFWSSIIVSQSYYDKDTTGQNDTGKGEGKTTSEMTKKSTFDGWDFDSTWSIKSSPASYPYLK